MANSDSYLRTFTTIAVTIIVFTASFYGAYLVYLRGQQDRYCEEIIKDLQDLDNLISHFSILEDLTQPPSWSWSPPIGKLYLILEKETWNQSPIEILKEPINTLENKYLKAREEEVKLMSQIEGRIPARAALYLEVKFALNDVISLLYREFPPPPGDYKVLSDGIPFAIKSYIRTDFPNNQNDFLIWAERYDLYYSGIARLYYQIRPIVYTLEKVLTEESQNLQEIIENKEYGLSQWQKESLKEIQDLYIRESAYYENIFQYLRNIKYSVDTIRDKISMYNKYHFKYEMPTGILFAFMSIFGIVIPLIILSPLKLENLMKYKREMSLIIPLLFGITTILAIGLIYLDIIAS